MHSPGGHPAGSTIAKPCRPHLGIFVCKRMHMEKCPFWGDTLWLRGASEGPFSAFSPLLASISHFSGLWFFFVSFCFALSGRSFGSTFSSTWSLFRSLVVCCLSRLDWPCSTENVFYTMFLADGLCSRSTFSSKPGLFFDDQVGISYFCHFVVHFWWQVLFWVVSLARRFPVLLAFFR